jgi:hypothetical protein
MTSRYDPGSYVACTREVAGGGTFRLVVRKVRDPRPWGVMLPSGLVHWFESYDAALQSQYWPWSVSPTKQEN